MSSIMINDNVIDLLATPGKKEGDPLTLAASPETSYVKFVNHLATSPAGTKPSFDSPDFVTNADGSVTVTLEGSLPVGSAPQPATIALPSPTRFAETVFRSEEHTSELQSHSEIVCRLLLEKKKPEYERPGICTK